MSTTASSLLSSLCAPALYDLASHNVVAVITGGGTGIGLNIAKTLAVNGAKVYIVGLKKEDVEPVAKVFNDGLKEIKAEGKVGEIIPLVADASQKSEALRLSKELSTKEPSGITVLFNNAGTAGEPFTLPSQPTPENLSETLLSYSYETFDPVLQTNLYGPYFFASAFLPLLAKYTEKNPESPFPAQVINTASINSFTKDTSTGVHMIPYILSKSALKQLTSLLAKLFLPTGVRVNAIAPGWFLTGMTTKGVDEFGRGIASEKEAEEALDGMGFKVPAGAMGGRQEDIGGLALMLVGNRFINGETILIDGGSLLVHPSSH